MSNAEVQAVPQAAAAGSARPVTDVPSMLLPVSGKSLLLPGVSVAEIVNYSYPEPTENAPEWLFGHITWRKLSVPLLSFEVLNGQAMAGGAGSAPRIAVLNNTGVSEQVPFLAIVIQGIPRLLRVTPGDIVDDGDAALSAAEMSAVRVAGGETVFIPDVGVLERAYLAYLNGAR